MALFEVSFLWAPFWGILNFGTAMFGKSFLANLFSIFWLVDGPSDIWDIWATNWRGGERSKLTMIDFNKDGGDGVGRKDRGMFLSHSLVSFCGGYSWGLAFCGDWIFHMLAARRELLAELHCTQTIQCDGDVQCSMYNGSFADSWWGLLFYYSKGVT